MACTWNFELWIGWCSYLTIKRLKGELEGFIIQDSRMKECVRWPNKSGFAPIIPSYSSVKDGRRVSSHKGCSLEPKHAQCGCDRDHGWKSSSKIRKQHYTARHKLLSDEIKEYEMSLVCLTDPLLACCVTSRRCLGHTHTNSADQSVR